MTRIHLNSKTAIPARYANRHGLITGATGTGKTVSLMTLAESFSKAGVPVFVADVKGDLSALARSCPTNLLDVYGEAGAPLQVPISAMGADLLSRSLELSDVQAGCLEIAFAYASATAAPLASLADLRAVLGAMIRNRESVSAEFGLIGAASISAIQRALLRLETQGAGRFFGAPGFDIESLLDPGRVSILAAEKLLHAPRLYGALLLWMLRELSKRLPEVGDLDKPRLVFIFDEAHTLFTDCPAPLLRQIEQTVRLIRSKGVGIYFASQSPTDIPELIRGQLATRLAHDRALGVGRAYFDTIGENGQPTPRVLIKPDMPTCQLGTLSPDERAALIPAAPLPAPGKSSRRVRPGLIFGAFAILLGASGAFLWSLTTGSPSLPAFGAAACALVALNRLPYPD